MSVRGNYRRIFNCYISTCNTFFFFATFVLKDKEKELDNMIKVYKRELEQLKKIYKVKIKE